MVPSSTRVPAAVSRRTVSGLLPERRIRRTLNELAVRLAPLTVNDSRAMAVPDTLLAERIQTSM